MPLLLAGLLLEATEPELNANAVVGLIESLLGGPPEAAKCTPVELGPERRTQPAAKTDGPFEPFGFRWQDKEVQFERATLRFRRVETLWNQKANAPHASRDATKVMAEIWPDDDTADDKLKNLVAKVRAAFEAAGLAVRVVMGGGKVWLKPLSG